MVVLLILFFLYIAVPRCFVNIGNSKYSAYYILLDCSKKNRVLFEEKDPFAMNINSIISQLQNHTYRSRRGVYQVDLKKYKNQSRNILPIVQSIHVPEFSANNKILGDMGVKSQMFSEQQEANGKEASESVALSSKFLFSIPQLNVSEVYKWDDCLSRARSIEEKERKVKNKTTFYDGPFLNTPIGVFVENVRYDTRKQNLEVFAPKAARHNRKQFYFQRLEEFTSTSVTILNKEPKQMKVMSVHPNEITSGMWIDEVLILSPRHYDNIYHNMEHINNLLHCTNATYHCPKFQYVLVYDIHSDYHIDFTEMYNSFVVDSLPMNYRPYFIDRSVLSRLKDGLYIKRALIMPILTYYQRTFNNRLEAMSVMKTAYRHLNISGLISKPKLLKLVYIKRLRTRQIMNEEDVLKVIRRDIGLDVFITRLENISPVDQVRLFSEADIAFGVHGAGFVNIVWMMPFSGVFDIMNPKNYREYYGYMSFVKELFYIGFRNVTMTRRFVLSHPRDIDVEVDVPSFTLFMRVMVVNVNCIKYAAV